VDAFAQCQECAADALPIQTCLFEPRCHGERCGRPELCSREHFVYLAFHGDVVKVGMTSSRRLTERGIEQGADAIAPIFRCRSRLEARTLEKEASRRFGLVQEVRLGKIMAQWPVEPSRERIQRSYDRALAEIGDWRGTLNEALTFLDGYPIRRLPDFRPQLMDVAGIHRGEVMGIKGRTMVHRRDGRVMALDLSALVARTMDVIPPQAETDINHGLDSRA